ncbi:hypothetical protein GB937_010749 [Aspergillus fischeri]|nr:hypothetical protein GB937_010749 [Aspergillus fischeri]
MNSRAQHNKKQRRIRFLHFPSFEHYSSLITIVAVSIKSDGKDHSSRCSISTWPTMPQRPPGRTIANWSQETWSAKLESAQEH